ncbi:HAMP domain-containing sensor histidine kinase [Ramlibacter solisilvae]|uniref:histidine kinase n=1 Tax=Ramlibacter tataouinensis TaxID=94132 RepID=A0A127JTU0_9BURK|nr:ATP-binding protein [Ramlibacter tataouinensis]AMO23335.1 histidine kinase [Ramlibacter tataouinensis]
MTPWQARFRFPLYLRIWIAVVAAVAVLSLAFGWLLRVSNEQVPEREVIIRNQAGEVLGQDRTRPMRDPVRGVEFQVDMKDGSTLFVQLPRRPRAPGEPPPARSWWRGPGGLLWMLAVVAVAVAIGTYPIIRRLTQRLEDLRKGVERWGEGDLSVRIKESGSDELAFLAQRFNHAAERVEALLKAHKSLLANASHELRSPLARIRMGLELMGPGASQASQDEIRRNIGELDQLIDEILLASRLDARETELGTVEAVDLTGLAAEECARADAELAPGGDGRALVVQGVAKLLRRAVRNLLENARRYSTGPVEVELRREGAEAVLRVRDHGPGVPSAEQERIFEPFYRLPGASERHGGVGLGLALVRSIAQRHHGSVRCESPLGGGACFVLRIPCHQM